MAIEESLEYIGFEFWMLPFCTIRLCFKNVFMNVRTHIPYNGSMFSLCYRFIAIFTLNFLYLEFIVYLYFFGDLSYVILINIFLKHSLMVR